MFDDFINFMGACFMILVSALLSVFIIYAALATYQSYQDSIACRAKTGLYNGCDLKLREHTENLNITSEPRHE